MTIKLGKKALFQKEHLKYLGVMVDSHLNWKHHIQSITTKISRSIGLMYRLRDFVNLNVLKNLYYCLIYSHIVYAIQIWGSANLTEINKILILQKKAVRMILRKDQYPQTPGPLYPSDPLFSELGILKVQADFRIHISKFIYDCLSHSTPSMFWDWFTYNHQVHQYNTTFSSTTVLQTNILHTQSSRLVHYGGKMIKVAGQLLWNSLPDFIRNSTSIHIFKNKLKFFLLEQYNSE